MNVPDTPLNMAMEDLRLAIDEMRCKATTADHDHRSVSHCAECCMGTMWLARDEDELEFLRDAEFLVQTWESLLGGDR